MIGLGVQARGLVTPVTGSVEVRVIVDPGIPLPLTTLSRVLSGLMVGAADTVGAVAASMTVVVAGVETLPAGSVAVALTTVPVASGVARVQE
jgi:hypothetical protein